MKLQNIILKGFKSFHELDLELSPLNVMIGPNGSGKSNFISVFKLLNEMVIGNFQASVARGGGAGTFLYYGEKVTKEIEVYLRFGANGYNCVWVPTADGNLFFSKEDCLFWGAYTERTGYREHLGSGHRESNLPNAAGRARVPGYVMNALVSWRLYHFHDTSDTAAVKRTADINDNLYLRAEASNLASVLYRLREGSRNYYEAIRDTIREVAPFFDDFLLRPDPTNETKIRLEWRERGSDYPFMAYHLSDGTLRFMCLATLLLQPYPPSTILIDEPELGLHPAAITILAGLLKAASTRTQVIVSTQSVPLVNQFEPQDILVLDRVQGQSTIRRLGSEEMKDWLDDFGLGDLWEKNLLGGRP
ncbi:AAA family ATPase [Nitrospiraceae bacterium AH_259_D15_M11_P09]|nr:AAA family ATPase [Nitrospiraceae bacterium AH_259_D15_M11_P09]